MSRLQGQPGTATLGEEPACDHVARPVHAQVDTASADAGRGQQRRDPRRRTVHAERAHTSADGQRG